MSKHVIELEDVSFAYDKHNKVLNGITFTIKEGEFVGLIGPNGSGKSTLLKIIMHDLIAQKGHVKILDTNINDFKYWQFVGYIQQNIGLLYQNFPASVSEIVGVNLYPKKIDKIKIKTMLETVGMEQYMNQLVYELSGGQMQRVAIAKALISNPKILVLDEPTTGIDKKTSQHLYQLLKELTKQGISIIMVTHDLVGCASYLDRTICIENGTMFELSKEVLEQELASKHQHPEQG